MSRADLDFALLEALVQAAVAGICGIWRVDKENWALLQSGDAATCRAVLQEYGQLPGSNRRRHGRAGGRRAEGGTSCNSGPNSAAALSRRLGTDDALTALKASLRLFLEFG